MKLLIIPQNKQCENLATQIKGIMFLKYFIYSDNENNPHRLNQGTCLSDKNRITLEISCVFSFQKSFILILISIINEFRYESNETPSI